MSYKFDAARFFPRRIMDAITEARVRRPEILEAAAERRKRRARPAPDGKLNMLACDHPGRGVIAVLDDPIAMGDRQQYLGRVARALLHPGLDGVMAHTDLVEDLLMLDYLLAEKGGRPLLDGRVVAGCMNRGGIVNVSGEIHDRFTTFTAESIARLRLDGGKMLLRVVNDDERTLVTLGECAAAVTDLSRHGLVAFVEPLPMRGATGSYASNYTVEELVKWVGICAGLGETSRNTWLKIPYIEGFERVTLATTLPILLLGGPAHGDPLRLLGDFAAGMRAGANARGAMVGRNVLFPGGEDPLAMTAAESAVIREGVEPEAALRLMDDARDSDLDALTRYL
jgi:hypothetical protein